MLLDRNKQLHRNILNPPQKDSFIVPNKGYVILRLFTDNLGINCYILFVLFMICI